MIKINYKYLQHLFDILTDEYMSGNMPENGVDILEMIEKPMVVRARLSDEQHKILSKFLREHQEIKKMIARKMEE